MLDQRTYVLKLLIRTGLAWQREFIPPIYFGDLGRRNAGLLKPRLVVLIIWLVGIECGTKEKPDTHLTELKSVRARLAAHVFVATSGGRGGHS